MLKSRAKLIAMSFIIFVIFAFIVSNKNYANLKTSNESITNWKVAITSDAKDLSDTRKMSFKVQDDPNIAKGKIAPRI